MLFLFFKKKQFILPNIVLLRIGFILFNVLANTLKFQKNILFC